MLVFHPILLRLDASIPATRMFLTDVSKWEQVGKVHGEIFASIRPATTLVEVARLIDAGAQIEIEADAIVA